MPQRRTSRYLASGGVALVLLSGALIVGPIVWGHPQLAARLMAQNAELDRISKRIISIRDTLDAIRGARTAERGYLLTGLPQELAAYRSRVDLARQYLAALHTTSEDPAASSRIEALIERMFADLARGIALQDAGRHEEAITASNIGTGNDLIATIEGMARKRIDTLRGQYLAVVHGMGDIFDSSDEFARIMIGLAGASFALGSIMLVAYLRRHLTAEAELRSGRDAALEASLMKSRFVATASHDLRQPLHAISMFVGVLRRRSRDPAILEVVENVATAVASMQRMFAALLDVARLDAGAVKIEPRHVALQDLFSALEVEFAASAAAKGLSLQIQPTSLSVTTDPALLETILRNLLSNAVKFTARGWVGLIARRRATLVETIVFDTGIGIAAEDQVVIFGQFERGARSGGGHEGLGLGLSIVQRMADLLGVAITVESQPGTGSQFTLSLPYAEPAHATMRDPAQPKQAPELRGRQILVLDDHPEARRALALAIATLGGVPLPAASPDAAFSLLAAIAPERPEAAIVDHDLGDGQTGPDFLDAYAARTGHALPAVIVTGSTEASTLARLVSGNYSWLIKPVDPDTLHMTLSRLIDLSLPNATEPEHATMCDRT